MGIECSKDYAALYRSRSLGNIDQFDSPINLFKHLNSFKNNYTNNWINQLFLPIFALNTNPNEKNFKVIEKIGNGAFGKVYKVVKRDDSKSYAMKVLKKSMILACEAIEQCKDEAYIQFMFGNNHPFILEALYIWQNQLNLYIVTEYLENGELHSMWAKFKKFSLPLTKIYVVEITSAIQYLHKSGIIYRDLKLENILLDSKGHIRLTDFGLSKWLPVGERTTTVCGTLVYMAPEIAKEELYGHSCDWWSLGILVFAMLFGTFPLYGIDDHVHLRAKMKTFPYGRLPFTYHLSSLLPENVQSTKLDAKYRESIVASYSHAIDLIHRLIEPDPSIRIQQAQEILIHPFNHDTPFPFDLPPIWYYSMEQHSIHDSNNDDDNINSVDMLSRWKSHPLWDLYFYKPSILFSNDTNEILSAHKYLNNSAHENIPYDKNTNLDDTFNTESIYEPNPKDGDDDNKYLQKNIKYKSIAMPLTCEAFDDSTSLFSNGLYRNRILQYPLISLHHENIAEERLKTNHHLNIYQNFYQLNARTPTDQLENSIFNKTSSITGSLVSDQITKISKYQDDTFQEFEYVSEDIFI